MDTWVQKAVHPYPECRVSKFTYRLKVLLADKVYHQPDGWYLHFSSLVKKWKQGSLSVQTLQNASIYIEHNIIRMRHPVPYKYTWCMCMFDSLALLTGRVGLVKPWVSQLCPALVSFLSTLCSFPLSWMDQEGPAYVRTCHKQCSVLFPHNNYKWHTICRLFDGNWSSTSLFSLLWKQT